MQPTRRRQPTCAQCPERPALDLIQPDDADPTRLLATCPLCGLWYQLLEPPGGRSTLTALPVPTRRELRIARELPPSEEESRAAMMGLLVTA